MFFILDNFLPFYLARYLTILPCPFTYLWKFQNNEKTPGDIIILHKCTKNHDHILYCPWDTAHDTCNCCYSFWVFFTPFTLLTAQKTKFQKNEKNPGDIIILHNCTKHYDQMIYGSWDMLGHRWSARKGDI